MPASHRLVTSLKDTSEIRSRRIKPRLRVDYYCTTHACRSPDFDYPNVARTRRDLNDAGWGGE